jgi:adenylate cyclase
MALKRRLRRLLPWSGAAMLGVWVGLLFGGLSLAREAKLLRLPFLEDVEEALLRAKFKLRGQLRPGGQVVIATVDERSLDRFGRWPWKRDVFADLVARLHAYGAKAVALDVVFDKSDEPPGRREARELLRALGTPAKAAALPDLRWVESVAKDDPDGRFAEILRKTHNTVLGFFLYEAEIDAHGVSPEELEDARSRLRRAAVASTPGSDRPQGSLREVRWARAPTARLAEAAGKRMGFFNLKLDEEGRIRGVPLAAKVGDVVLLHLAARAVCELLGFDPIVDFRMSPPRFIIEDKLIPTEEDGLFHPNYYGPRNTFKHFSIADIVDGVVPTSELSGKMVFVGATAFAVPDLRRTPFDEVMPGVEIHATVADNILTGRYLSWPSELYPIELGAFLLLAPLLAFAMARARILGSVLWALGALVAAGSVDLLLFRRGIALRSAMLYGEILTVVMGSYVLLYFRVYKERKRLRNTMRHYLARPVLKEMLRDQRKLQLGGEKRDLTVLLSDIRGFTALAETFDARDLVAFLNEYFTPMTNVVLRHHGTFDKYMGDALMAFFGAPQVMIDHPVRACRAALDMRSELVSLNARWRARGLPEIQIGIGLNSGPMAFGNMGSAQLFNYTVVGDNVNLASRIESSCKLFGATILASETTAAAAEGELLFRRLGDVYVAGKSEPIRVLELVGTAAERPVLTPWLDSFARALAHFESRDLDGADAEFARAAALHDDPPAAAYRARIASLRGVASWEPAWRGGK